MSAILALYNEFNKWNLIHLLRLTEWNFKVKSDVMIAKLCSASTHGQQCTEGYWRLTDLWSLYEFMIMHKHSPVWMMSFNNTGLH